MLLKSSCFLDLNVMFTKVTTMDKIELIYMAGVFVFSLSSVVFSVNCPPKLSQIEKCHDRPSLE